MSRSSSAAAGFAFALAAAAAFGATAPLIQRVGHSVGAFATAALLYAGAAIVASFTRRPASAEAPLRARHLPRLLAIALAGAVAAPAALAWGLQHTSGTSAGLMLDAEAPLTVLLGAFVHREPVGRRVRLALACMVLGAVLLFVGRPSPGNAEALGLLAVFVATLGWALDNTWTAPLSTLDVSSVVVAKSAAGACVSAILAFALREPWPAVLAGTGLLACGATGYGASLRLYLLAQRRLGAARTASIFGVAPFLAAIVAAVLGQPVGVGTVLAVVPMAIGLALHATERHAHWHVHEPLEHEHAHVHDDGHHGHSHEHPPIGPHSHEHAHAAVEHTHEHMPDAHHGHRH